MYYIQNRKDVQLCHTYTAIKPLSIYYGVIHELDLHIIIISCVPFQMTFKYIFITEINTNANFERVFAYTVSTLTNTGTICNPSEGASGGEYQMLVKIGMFVFEQRIVCVFWMARLYCIVVYCRVLYCNVFYQSTVCLTVSYCIVLYCIALYCIVLYCIVLYCIVLYCIVLYCIVLYRIVSYRIVSYRIVSYRIVLYCTIHCTFLYRKRSPGEGRLPLGVLRSLWLHAYNVIRGNHV